MNDLDCVGKGGGVIKALVHDSVSSAIVGTLAGPQSDQRDVTGSVEFIRRLTIRYSHALLRSALKQAIRWKPLLASPADLVDLPKQARRGTGIVSVEQARALMTEIGRYLRSPSPRSVCRLLRF
jgi:hypothetical protein